MRRAVIVVGPLLVGLAACAPRSVAGVATVPTSVAAPTSTTRTVAAPPASPHPVADGKCPYLASAFVQDANGQRVSKVRVSADKPHPACFFYRADGRVQLTAWIYVGDPGVAKALVDQAAPLATSDPAQLPAGWAGGSQATGSGAVFAVAKGGSAVVITTNQAQTIKAKRVAESAIATLGL